MPIFNNEYILNLTMYTTLRLELVSICVYLFHVIFENWEEGSLSFSLRKSSQSKHRIPFIPNKNQKFKFKCKIVFLKILSEHIIEIFQKSLEIFLFEGYEIQAAQKVPFGHKKIQKVVPKCQKNFKHL